jgi:hypothetical protein
MYILSDSITSTIIYVFLGFLLFNRIISDILSDISVYSIFTVFFMFP